MCLESKTENRTLIDISNRSGNRSRRFNKSNLENVLGIEDREPSPVFRLGVTCYRSATCCEFNYRTSNLAIQYFFLKILFFIMRQHTLAKKRNTHSQHDDKIN